MSSKHQCITVSRKTPAQGSEYFSESRKRVVIRPNPKISSERFSLNNRQGHFKGGYNMVAAVESFSEEAELVRGIGEGDRSCESRFVEKFRDKVVQVLTVYIKDPVRAEDFTHDALMVVIRRMRDGDIANPSSLASYTFSTAKFMYLGSLRRMDSQLDYSE